MWESGAPLHYVVLRTDEDTCVRRAAARAIPDLSASGPVRSMHRQFLDLPATPHQQRIFVAGIDQEA